MKLLKICQNLVQRKHVLKQKSQKISACGGLGVALQSNDPGVTKYCSTPGHAA